MASETPRPKYIGSFKAGNIVEIDLDEHWDTICKILRICRLVTSPNHTSKSDYEMQSTRLAFLAERMSDLEGITFYYKRRPFESNIDEIFVPAKQPIIEKLNNVAPPN